MTLELTGAGRYDVEMQPRDRDSSYTTARRRMIGRERATATGHIGPVTRPNPINGMTPLKPPPPPERHRRSYIRTRRDAFSTMDKTRLSGHHPARSTA